MKLHHRHAPAPRSFQFVPWPARLVVGIVTSLSIVSALGLLFGPFSDLSAIQLAAGPQATTDDGQPAPIVQANTGRDWGAVAEQRQAAASSVGTQVATRGANR